MNDPRVIEWLRKAIETSGIKQAELARRIGLPRRDAIGLVLQGKRNLKSQEALDIARVLNIDPPLPTHGSSENNVQPRFAKRPEIRYVTVQGEVAAGSFKDMEYGFKFKAYEIPVPVDPRWPDGAVYGLVIRGESINRKAADGDHIVVLDAEVSPRPVRNGDWVVVERTKLDLRETTVKRVEMQNDGSILLCPDSSEPEFVPVQLGETDGETVRIVAFVLGFYSFGSRF